jgi:hypothetical protein
VGGLTPNNAFELTVTGHCWRAANQRLQPSPNSAFRCWVPSLAFGAAELRR